MVKKGKAVIADPSPQQDHPSIKVLEEATAAAPTRPDELITLQSRGGSRWFIQHMPHSGSAASDNTQISRPEDNSQSNIPPARTSGDAKEETAAATVVAQAVAAAAEQVEKLDQSASSEAARAEVAHRAYKNTRVRVTILRRLRARQQNTFTPSTS